MGCPDDETWHLANEPIKATHWLGFAVAEGVIVDQE